MSTIKNNIFPVDTLDRSSDIWPLFVRSSPFENLANLSLEPPKVAQSIVPCTIIIIIIATIMVSGISIWTICCVIKFYRKSPGIETLTRAPFDGRLSTIIIIIHTHRIPLTPERRFINLFRANTVFPIIWDIVSSTLRDRAGFPRRP